MPQAVSASHKRPPDQKHAPAREAGLNSRPWLRRLIGAALLLHLIAVIVAPLAVLVAPRDQPPGGGPPRPRADGEGPSARPEDVPAEIPDEHKPVVDLLEEFVFRPYLDLLYLNHGYSFFAPEPGPSYVMEYEVHRADDTVVRGRLPDAERHWPRLLYHRYFMLATQNFSLMMDATARGAISPDSTETLGHAIAREVTRRYGGEYGVLRLFMHRLLWPEEVLQGKSPEAPDTYLPEGQIIYSTTGELPDLTNRPEDATPPAEEVQP